MFLVIYTYWSILKLCFNKLSTSIMMGYTQYLDLALKHRSLVRIGPVRYHKEIFLDLPHGMVYIAIADMSCWENVCCI
jgi:hypothetical protein